MQKKYALYVVICLSKTEQYNIENNLKCVDYVSRKADSILVQKKKQATAKWYADSYRHKLLQGCPVL